MTILCRLYVDQQTHCINLINKYLEKCRVCCVVTCFTLVGPCVQTIIHDRTCARKHTRMMSTHADTHISARTTTIHI